jgi:GNAT superfamily N-acetyltransferase
MTAAPRPRSGRKAFRGMGPKGYRLRLMEPGEAEALLTIREATGEPGRHRPKLADFVRFLLAHEVYVAQEKRGGNAVGYAVASGEGPVYWLLEQRVHPAHRGRGIAAALLEAVTQRARWFDHDALALADPVALHGDASFWTRLGFAPVPAADLPLRPIDVPLLETPVPGKTVTVKRL